MFSKSKYDPGYEKCETDSKKPKLNLLIGLIYGLKIQYTVRTDIAAAWRRPRRMKSEMIVFRCDMVDNRMAAQISGQ